MPSLDALRAERDAAERHIADTDREGGCKRSMFLGDCPDCERYWSLDDRVRDDEAAVQTA